MNYLKFTQYLYLAASLFFAYTAFDHYQERESDYWLWLGIAFLCFFLFLFRRNYARKFEERARKREQDTQSGK